jgi:predicted TIM-barrel fold metal-dependent hydrolase
MPTKGYIDADGHVIDSDQMYRDYLEEPYRRRGPVTPHIGDGFDRFLYGRLGQQGRGGGPGRPNAQDWLDALDRGEVDATVLYPTTALAVGFITEPDFAVAFCRAYNNWLADQFSKQSPRLHGVAIIPLQDIGEAVKEMRRAVTELGAVGVMLPADGPYLPPTTRSTPKPSASTAWSRSTRPAPSKAADWTNTSSSA